MTLADFAITSAFGVAGSLHCVQMCGPILLACNLPRTRRTSGSLAAGHIFYHLGRIATYTLLGALAGSFGSALSAVAKWQSAAAIFAGALMIVAGLLIAGSIKRPELLQIAPARSFITKAASMIRAPGMAARIRLGALMGFIPCGLVYAALLRAVAPANALDGALHMTAFGLGTSLPLLALGILSAPFGNYLSKYGRTISAVAVTAFGVLLVIRAMLPVTSANALHHH